jgi:hypothetical protein
MQDAHAARIDPWKRELAIAAVLVLGFGLLILPFAIYWVGTQIIGEYAPDGDAFTLAERIWTDLLALDPFTWVLVASPYVVVLLARLVRRLWRSRAV